MTCSEAIVIRITNLRTAKGWTVNHLAVMAGLRQSTVNNIVEGRSKNTGIITLVKLASAFSMTVAEFLDFPEMNNIELE